MFTKATIHTQGVTLYDHRGIARGFNFRVERRKVTPQHLNSAERWPQARECRPQDSDSELSSGATARCFDDDRTIGLAVLPPDFKF
jgi:hypothetical protein